MAARRAEVQLAREPPRRAASPRASDPLPAPLGSPAPPQDGGEHGPRAQRQCNPSLHPPACCPVVFLYAAGRCPARTGSPGRRAKGFLWLCPPGRRPTGAGRAEPLSFAGWTCLWLEEELGVSRSTAKQAAALRKACHPQGGHWVAVTGRPWPGRPPSRSR